MNTSGMLFFKDVVGSFESPETYDRFFHLLISFIEDRISRSEFVQNATPLVAKHPDLYKWFKGFLGIKDRLADSVPNPIPVEPVPIPQNLTAEHDDQEVPVVIDVDVTGWQKYGPSYYIIPEKQYQRQPQCSGRTALCKEVLNDTLISYPRRFISKLSRLKLTALTGPRKDVRIYDDIEDIRDMCEDERFELDNVMEPNWGTIAHFESLDRKMNQMPPQELLKFKLNDGSEGPSPGLTVSHKNAIRLIYGDIANDIIEGVKNHPRVAVPIVLKRLKAKRDEWRDEQKVFNEHWRTLSSGSGDHVSQPRPARGSQKKIKYN